jgi:hypothetical protein
LLFLIFLSTIFSIFHCFSFFIHMNDDVSSFLSFTSFKRETWNTSWMFSRLMKNWVYTISCLLTHLSYTSRNICNSVFWTISLKWCFLHSKKLYHLSWIRFKLSFYYNFSSLFLKSAFNELRTFVSSLTRVRRDLAQQKRRFWDLFE